MITNFLKNVEFCSSPQIVFAVKYVNTMLITEHNDANGLVSLYALDENIVSKLTTAATITGIFAVVIAVIVVTIDFLFSLFIIYTIAE